MYEPVKQMDKVSKEKKVTKSPVTANQILARANETSKNMTGSYTDIDPVKTFTFKGLKRTKHRLQ